MRGKNIFKKKGGKKMFLRLFSNNRNWNNQFTTDLMYDDIKKKFYLKRYSLLISEIDYKEMKEVKKEDAQKFLEMYNCNKTIDELIKEIKEEYETVYSNKI
jgi:ribosomal protein L20A (L18A)